jgi:hypothetical protein
MLGLKLREEFAGRRKSGTMIELHNSNGTGALDKSASEFLAITYPSIDLLKTVEVLRKGKSEPTVIIGGRGQGKSHIMAAASHLIKDEEAGQQWLDYWAAKLSMPELGEYELDSGKQVITETLHKHRYARLWDVLFDQHPKGEYAKGKWEAQGEKQTTVPGEHIIMEMLQVKPVVLVLDEFQTWYDDQKNKTHKSWAFSFIQILSEISREHPELLTLIVSVRDGASDAAQQIYRVDPRRIDFTGLNAKRDRQRLLLYRIFENRFNIADQDVRKLLAPHVGEYFRLYHISAADQEKYWSDYIEAWPFSPRLMQLLEDQVLIAAAAQETRDLLRILVDVFKQSAEKRPIITPADFDLTSDKSGITALLDSVANQVHKDLKEKALRNLQAVEEGVKADSVPNLNEILSALWLRSMSLENNAGGEAAELQLDITRDKAIDDNQFAAQLAIIEENSFNIHPKGTRLVFLNEENPRAKLVALAKSDRNFEGGEDIEYLAKEVRYALAGEGGSSQAYQTVVLQRKWREDPWSEQEEANHPGNWDKRIPVIVMPASDIGNKELGLWLKINVPKNRNRVRYLLPTQGSDNVFYDQNLQFFARAAFLAQELKMTDPAYSPWFTKYQGELRSLLKTRFDRFAVLMVWNFENAEDCEFEITRHGAEGSSIISTVQDRIVSEFFEPEAFEEMVGKASNDNWSVLQLLEQLSEPARKGAECIPWLGETEIKERLIRSCANGHVTINVGGSQLLQKKPSESSDEAWHRMKGQLGTGRQLEETTLHEPGSAVGSGGGAPEVPISPTPLGGPVTGPPSDTPGGNITPPPGGLFGGARQHYSAPATNGLSLYGKLEQWGINQDSKVYDVKIKTEQLNGTQLADLLKKLPDGVSYELDLDKE